MLRRLAARGKSRAGAKNGDCHQFAPPLGPRDKALGLKRIGWLYPIFRNIHFYHGPLGGLLLAGAVMLSAGPPPTDPDLAKQLQTVERSIDGRFGQAIDEESPMSLTGVTRGLYLEGFGVVFSLEVNAVPTPGISPFFRGYDEEQKRALNRRKQERLKLLEARAREILVREAAKVASLPADQTLALAISLFYYNWEYVTGLPFQVVVQAPKRALLDHGAGRLTDAELDRQVEVTSLF